MCWPQPLQVGLPQLPQVTRAHICCSFVVGVLGFGILGLGLLVCWLTGVLRAVSEMKKQMKNVCRLSRAQ